MPGMVLQKMGFPDWLLTPKVKPFKEAGYMLDTYHEMAIHLDTKKAFSSEFIEAHSEEELRECVQAPRHAGTGWHFYFTISPDQSVLRKIEGALDLWLSAPQRIS